MKPILSRKSFFSAHDIMHHSIIKKTTTRLGRDNIERAIIDEMMDRSAKQMYSNNIISRTTFAETLDGAIRNVFEENPALLCGMLTIAPAEYMLPLKDGRHFDLNDLKDTVSGALDGLNYIGLVEAALYPRSPLFPGPMLSWHAHCLMWHSDMKELKDRARGLNRKFPSAIPGLASVHLIALSQENLAKRAFYISKGQIRQYNVFLKKYKGNTKSDNGEFLVRYHQQKTPIRPSNAVVMASIMQKLTLKDLSVSGGNGNCIIRDCFDKSIAKIRRKIKLRKNAIDRIIQRKNYMRFDLI